MQKTNSNKAVVSGTDITLNIKHMGYLAFTVNLLQGFRRRSHFVSRQPISTDERFKLAAVAGASAKT
jgi:hypothetical protein